jgi:hypothetical protein
MAKLRRNVIVAYAKLREAGGLMCRQYSGSDEAEKRGDRYLYFRVKDGLKIGTAGAKFLIENGLVESSSDGLFADTPQTFRAVDPEKFDSFKARYEAV